MRRISGVLLWAWLAAGLAAFIHGIVTGGGVAGIFLYQQLRMFGGIDDALTHVLLALPLIGFPIALLARHADKGPRPPPSVYGRRIAGSFWIIGAVLVAGAAVIALQPSRGPDRAAPPQRISLDQPGGAMPPEGNAILFGTARRDWTVDYREYVGRRLSAGNDRTIRYEPITPTSWTPADPVHFILRRGYLAEDTAATPAETRKGVLLRGQLPGFVREAFARRGLLIADDVMIHSTDPGAGRTGWYTAAALVGGLGLLLLLFGATFTWTMHRSARRSR